MLLFSDIDDIPWPTRQPIFLEPGISGIDIPEEVLTFTTLKRTYGAMSSRLYFSKVTNSWRRLYVYTPPGYDKNINQKYPVVYLQHGGGEDETGWVTQGKTDLVLDNLFALGKAKPMIVVIANGNVRASAAGYTSEAMESFKMEMTQNIVPFIDENYRTLANRKNRAICGLSMGGGQSFYAGLENLDIFSAVGIFSSGLFGGIRTTSANAFDAEKEIPVCFPNRLNSTKNSICLHLVEGDMRIDHTKSSCHHARKRAEVEFNSFLATMNGRFGENRSTILLRVFK